MANSKSAEKRNRQNLVDRESNRIYKGSARTAVKKARALIEAGDAAASDAVQVAEKALDKAAQHGAIHSMNASRRKGRLKIALNKATAQA
ncbi:MAG: 30S ribosomal protein S20 [Caldilineaceae bacterium]|nr:30S ribosomal protein S20 [Caldilineaceae bacterium]MBP8110298.1 30S ribosomal protein S20 [Caldilineaceae bacterium]MBP8123974.1 30S ribosomal protein S20 [Caldilineaceae bacterium]MBP9074031.1 30S ribosomal protein S20 [Caldilineaceae bacterium]